ncbi:hypothetical protein RB653_001969 [Dictyostelium firmibasis]|uniref:Uncharacterized protein n=1 Tax=Dictyostelium firmibasis TaxID=79012 RepID=A0AAN7TVM8_9MYCE
MEYNEILFWKVIHNKFIFNIIIGQISKIQLEYERINLYKIGNRIKFKEFQSLKQLISKKQFKLLKYKLECNEFILYNKESVDILIQLAPIEIIRLFIEEHRIKYQDPKLEKLNVMINLVYHSVKNKNIECLKYFINELQLPIETIVFEYTLKENSIEFIDLILNSNQFKIEETTRKSCLKLISNNSTNFKDIIDYIVNKRPELNYYSTKTILEKSNQQYQQQLIQQPKLSPYLNRPQLLDFYLFYNLKSKEIKLKLLEIGCVFRVQPEYIYSNKLTPNNWQDYEEIDLYLSIVLKLCDFEKSLPKDTTLAAIKNEIDRIKENQKITTKKKCKKIHELTITKLFTKFSSHIYREYFYLYDQVIPNTDYTSTFQFTFSSFSVNGLNYLLSLKNTTASGIAIPTNPIYINEISKVIKADSDNSDNEKGIIEFLKIYFKSKQLLPQLNRVSVDNMFLYLLKNCSIEALDEILKLKPQDDIIKGFLNSFLPDNNLETSTIKADKLLKTINDNKDIDRFQWILEKLFKKVTSLQYENFIYNKLLFNNISVSTKFHIDYLIEFKPKSLKTPLDKKYLEIESLELIEYLQTKLNLSKPSQFHYIYLYIKSLFNNGGDDNGFKTYEVIDNIENLIIELSDSDFKSIKINDQKSMLEIIQHINKSKLKSLSNNSVIKVFEFLLSNNENLQSIVIENLQFNLFPTESMKLLLDNILNVNVQITNGIINNLVMNGEFELSNLVKTINKYEKNEVFTIYKSLDGKLTKNGFKAKDQLIPFIKSLFNKLEANIDELPSLSSCFEINFIFSYLYKLLIQCDDITLSLINNVRQFYFDNGLVIIDDLFSISCYLGLRSNQFIKYLSGMKIRLENGSYFLGGSWQYSFERNRDYTLDFNLMLKLNKGTIDKDFFDVIYQTTKSDDTDFFKEIVFFKLRNLMVELFQPHKLSIANEIYLLTDLNRADMILELAEIEISENQQFPIDTINGLMNIITLEQFKQLISILGFTESKRIKLLLLKNSIVFRKFEFIDYLIKESDLFIEEFTTGSIENKDFKVFKDLIITNDIETIKFLLKNYRGQDFQKNSTTLQPITSSIDLFENFQYSQNLHNNNFQVSMDNGLIDMYDLLSRHFPFVPRKDNIIHAIRLGRIELIKYFYENNYFEHLGEETISSVNDFIKFERPNQPDLILKKK